MFILEQVIIVIVSGINNLKTAFYTVAAAVFILGQIIIVIVSGMNNLKARLLHLSKSTTNTFAKLPTTDTGTDGTKRTE